MLDFIFYKWYYVKAVDWQGCFLIALFLLKEHKKINNCIANSKSFYWKNKDEYERQKIFILVKIKLIWLIKQKR